MGYRLPVSSVHGIFQAIVLEWIAISFSRGSSQPRDQTRVSHIVDRCFTFWATREVPELAETHVYRVSNAIQPSHPLSSASPPAFSRSQHQGLSLSQFFASGGQSIGASASASVLPMNIQNWFPLGWTGWISLQSKWLSRVLSNTTVQKHQFFSAQFSL